MPRTFGAREEKPHGNGQLDPGEEPWFSLETVAIPRKSLSTADRIGQSSIPPMKSAEFDFRRVSRVEMSGNSRWQPQHGDSHRSTCDLAPVSRSRSLEATNSREFSHRHRSTDKTHAFSLSPSPSSRCQSTGHAGMNFFLNELFRPERSSRTSESGHI